MLYNPIDISRQFSYIREASQQNRGLRVESIQHWAAGNYGDSWCMEFVWFVWDIASGGAASFERQGSVEAFRQWCKHHGFSSTGPVVGGFVMTIDPTANHAHHIGIVTSVTPLISIAGNTSVDGSDPNGNGVHEHEISYTNKEFTLAVS